MRMIKTTDDLNFVAFYVIIVPESQCASRTEPFPHILKWYVFF